MPPIDPSPTPVPGPPGPQGPPGPPVRYFFIAQDCNCQCVIC